MGWRRTDQALAQASYYAATAGAPPLWPSLQGDLSCDVAVVGAGLAGLSAALELRQRGRDVVLLEAGTPGGGASGRNGGQSIHGLACDMDTVAQQLGRQAARAVWDATVEGLDLMRARATAPDMDCEWRDGVLLMGTTARRAQALQRWADALARDYDYPLQRIAAAESRAWVDSPRYHGGVHDPRSGHLHPLKFCHALARTAQAAGVRVYAHSAVTALEAGPPPRLRTAAGSVRAQQVLLAGNVYLEGLVPALRDRIMPVGTYIACSEPLPPALAHSLVPSGAAVCDSDFVLDYFRVTADHRLLYGGLVSYSTRTPADVGARLQQRWLRTFPSLQGRHATHAWGGFVDITRNRAPDFGRLGPDGRPVPPGAAAPAGAIYYLQGFSGHGLALSGLAGRLAAEALCGDAGRFDVFARLRHARFPGGPWLRTPALVLGMSWYRLRDMLG